MLMPNDLGLTSVCPAVLLHNATVALVSDQPTPREHATRTPFSGLRKLVLNKAFEGSGMQVDACHHLLLTETPGRPLYADDKKTTWFSSMAPWLKLLSARLAALRPNVTVALSDDVLYALCGVRGLNKYRGSVLPCTLVPGLKVIPMDSPEYIMAGNFGALFIAQHDAKRIVEQSAFPDIRREAWTAVTEPKFAEARMYIGAIRKDEPWSLDIETRADSLACLGLAFGSTALCIPIQTTQGPYFSAEQELCLWRDLNHLFRTNPNLIGQNLAFDLEWLLGYGLMPVDIRLDTMLGFALLYPEFPKGLDMIVSLYTDAPYYKDDGKTWGWKQPDAKLRYYNCQDCFYTLRAGIGIEKELFSRGQLGDIKTYTNKALYAALEMQRTRLKVNKENHARLRSIAQREADSIRAFRGLLSPTDININSPKQVKAFLYGTKQLKPVFSKGKPSVDENALKKLRTVYPECQELELIITERHLRKKLSSYLNVELDLDDHLGCAWNVAGTETGRWSSGKSAHRRGLNLQTVPKLLRFSYEAPPGRVFLQPDLSQAEARVSAYLARCGALISLFSDPSRSIHMENAKAIFGHPVVKDTKDYVLAKQCLHAANYKMGPDRFAVEAGISRDRAKEILETYYATYPELGLWHTRTREALLSVGKLVTPLGRERMFYHARAEVLLTGSLSAESWRNAIAYVPQATVPDVLNKGMLKTWEELDYLWLHHQGHDSCLVSVPYDKLGECARQLGSNLRIAIPMGTTSLTIPVEMAWGFLWNPMLPWRGEEDALPLRASYDAYVAEHLTDEYIAQEMK